MMIRFRFQVFLGSLSFASALIPLTPSLAGIQNFSSIQTSSPAGMALLRISTWASSRLQHNVRAGTVGPVARIFCQLCHS